MNFALIGAGGYVAKRHLEAMKACGGNLLFACDVNDSVGLLDNYFPECTFFTAREPFERALCLLQGGETSPWLAVCTPNYLHESHIRMGLSNGWNVICEKPLVLNPTNLKQIEKLISSSSLQVSCLLQLRYHPAIMQLKETVAKVRIADPSKRFKINLRYISQRGDWYFKSWKGDVTKSGGLLFNIGIHFFDMLFWIFGDVIDTHISQYTKNRVAGEMSLEAADVNWVLSVDADDLAGLPTGTRTYRRLEMDGVAVDFTHGFESLHEESYKQILAGNGFSTDEVRSSLSFCWQLRTAYGF